jgi:hypothetical protein
MLDDLAGLIDQLIDFMWAQQVLESPISVTLDEGLFMYPLIYVK